MSTPHQRQHELLLRAVVSGDLDERDPALDSVLEECAECREQWEGLAHVRTLLDHTARDEASSLSELDWSRAAPGREVVGAFVRERVAEQEGRRRAPRPWWRRAWVAAAAAGILVSGWIVRWLMPPRAEPGADVMLGDSATDGMTPSGSVDEYTPLSWKLRLPPGGRFELRIWDGATGRARPPFVELRDVQEPHWIPTSAQTRGWPDAILWEVQSIDATNAFVAARETRANR